MSNINQFHYTSQAISNRDSWLHRKVFGISSKKLDWYDKGVVFGLSQEFIALKSPHTHLTKIWYQNVQDHSGLSIETIKKGVTKLEKAKAVVRENRWVEDRVTREKKKRTFIAFTPSFLFDPESLFVVMPDSNHGGLRTIRRHKGCGGEIVFLCTTCGQTHIADCDTYIQYVDDSSQQPVSNAQSIELQQLDAIANTFNPTVDAIDIPDYLVDAHGGNAETVLNMPLQELQKASQLTREEWEGVTPDDIEEAARQIKEMNERYKEDPGWI